LHVAATAAVGTRIGDDGAGALTGGTRRLHAKDAGRLHNLAVTTAVAARGPLRAGLAAGALTGRASFIFGELNGFHDAASGFFQRQRDIDAEIGAAANAAAPAAAAGHTEHLTEDVAEGVED